MLKQEFTEPEIDESQHEPMMRLITFNIENEVYGVEVDQVKEILRVQQVVPVPGAPACVAGITNIRGSVVTIIDARSRLDLPMTAYTDSARMIVIESEEDVAALVVDSVSDVIDIPRSNVETNPGVKSREDSPYVDGLISGPGGLIIMLNTTRLIEDDSMGMAAGF